MISDKANRKKNSRSFKYIKDNEENNILVNKGVGLHKHLQGRRVQDFVPWKSIDFTLSDFHYSVDSLDKLFCLGFVSLKATKFHTETHRDNGCQRGKKTDKERNRENKT